ncbi:MAG: site-2 protease family protein [Oscillospiraceae bacterium]|nr:site-2 protease family protein [Oscillospiraceae bacterium]
MILLHEFGHFVTAKACGVRVEEFAVGMGPAIWKKQTGETLYALRAIPLGGYCAMAGEDGELPDDPRAFTNQKAWKRAVILVAGAAMNFITGLILLFIVFSSAGQLSVPVIGSFFEGCPYEESGVLQVGDEFYSVDGHRTWFPGNVSTYLARGGDTHDVVLIRDGEKVTLERITFERQLYPGETQELIGFRFSAVDATFGRTIVHSWRCALDFVRMVYSSLRDLFAGVVGVKDLSGPVGIVSMINDVGETSESRADALINIFYFIAFISVNLAVMNLLPIPALDGGRIFLLIVTGIIEAITRRRIDPKYEGYIHTAGMVLLLGLMAFVMYQDFARIIMN